MARYIVVIDMPDTAYPADDPFYWPSGKDPYGATSMADYITCSLDEPGYRPTNLTVYPSMGHLLADWAEGLDMFAREP